VKPRLSDIEFEPLDRSDSYVERLLRWAEIDAEITFGWRIFVRGEQFGIVWVEMFKNRGLIHGATSCRGRYVPFVSVQAFRLAERAIKSLGLMPSVFYSKDLLQVERLCDIVGYRRVLHDYGKHIEVVYGK
jgi:hypothetical protein